MIRKKVIQSYINTVGRSQSINSKILNMALKASGYNVHHQNSGEDLFIQSMKDPKICIDVGANRGQYATLLLENTNAKVISFEPNAMVFELLEKLAKSYPDRLQPINKGVADKNTTLTLHHCSENKIIGGKTGFASFSEEVKQIPMVRNANTEATPVEVIKLDDFDLPEEIDLIKMDVEGFEYEVLKGMADIVKNKRVKYIQLEYGTHQFYRGYNLSNLAELMPGYVSYQLTRYKLVKRDAMSPEAQFYSLSNWVFAREDCQF